MIGPDDEILIIDLLIRPDDEIQIIDLPINKDPIQETNISVVQR